MVNFYFEAPLKLIIDKSHKESQQITRKSNVLRENIERIQYLAAPLGRLYSTLVCRGTSVEWLRTTDLTNAKQLFGTYELKV